MRLRRGGHARLQPGHRAVTEATAQRWVQVQVIGPRWWSW
jgi:hypothetical protein